MLVSQPGRAACFGSRAGYLPGRSGVLMCVVAGSERPKAPHARMEHGINVAEKENTLQERNGVVQGDPLMPLLCGENDKEELRPWRQTTTI
jgi:hypothetical protein